MTTAELLPWFQMASTVLTGLGVMISMSLGIASLNNSKRDRLVKIRPNLLFNIGGQVRSATISPLKSFPGIAPNDPDTQKLRNSIAPGATCLELLKGFGQLFNHGQGTAIDAQIWFEPQRVTSGGQDRWLSKTEQGSAPYTKEWNTIPATPANIPPGKDASFFRLPTSVFILDPIYEAISGRVRIECRDAEGTLVEWRQDATFFIDRTDASNASVTVSFEPRSM